MRTNKELLQVFLDNQHAFSTGLCNWTDKLSGILSWEERLKIENLIEKHKPILAKLGISKDSKWNYYWKKGEIKPRIKWLKKHLK